MTNDQVKTTYLKDYQPPAYWVDSVDLIFDLYDDKTIVSSTLKCRRDTGIKENAEVNPPLVLQGEELLLKEISINGKKLETKDYSLTEETLSIPNTTLSAILNTTSSDSNSFTLSIVNEIHPEKNTALCGLYKSKSMFCTQCEAEGFRRITFFQDRPDVMSKFTTTIRADKKKYPVLLSNGNCIEKGNIDTNRHWVKWEDPFKKPCYLFALVAGDLVALEDHYITQSGRLVTLKIFVEWENQDKCAHAINALKKSMEWDEKTYGREYDLDIYMIVAVNDFNMGAMENKGLNIFNSKYILARPETASDGDFYHIDAVVGHEYFHNWSGNRVTCRDWFQLSLKEGFTVFREHHFSREITGSTVSLIENARVLRGHQFAEDSGPLAHPVRPDSYVEINNFYTSTVYEKGAEVIRMIKTLLGWENFRKGTDLYFKKFDGRAVTIEDFVATMEEVSNRDLTQFKLWYTQAGTPAIEVEEDYNDNDKTYRLTLKQSCPKTPGQPHKLPMHIPIAVGLLNQKGEDILKENGNMKKTRILELTKEVETFEFPNMPNMHQKPTLSILREFSAPVKIKSSLTNEDLAFLLQYDSDDFNRWDAGQHFAVNMILEGMLDHHNKKPLQANTIWFQSIKTILENKSINKALKTEILTLPSTPYIMECMDIVDIDAIYEVKKFIREEMSREFRKLWIEEYHNNLTPGLYQYNTRDAEKRGLKNLSLAYLLEQSDTPDDEVMSLCMKQWHEANNMTDRIAVVSILADVDCKEREEVLKEFYDRWQHDPLVVNKWLRVQATSQLPNTLEVVKKLMEHPAFDIRNPNKVYALIGGFSSNLIRFHDKSGNGYQFLAEVILKLDSLNPQVASRMMDAFTRIRRFDKDRQQKMQKALEMLNEAKISKDVKEKVVKTLNT